MTETPVLSPILRHTLRVILPISLLFGSGCQMVRSASAPLGSSRKSDAEFALRQDIVREAATHIGTRYLHGGTSPKRGFDCSGFTSYVMGRFEISVSPHSGTQAGQGKEIEVDKALPGDIVYFTRSRGGRVFHVGLVEENTPEGLIVIHSSSSRGVVRDNVHRSDYWRPKIAGVRRVIPPADRLAGR